MLAASQSENVVSSVALALPISPKNAVAWKKRLPPARYKAGQVLFYRGHYAYGVLIIHEGEIALKISERDNHTPIRVGPNTILGLSPIVAGKPCPLTAVVVEDVVASFAEKNQLLTWLKEGDRLLPPQVRFADR